jgi:hypothetical protein
MLGEEFVGATEELLQAAGCSKPLASLYSPMSVDSLPAVIDVLQAEGSRT